MITSHLDYLTKSYKHCTDPLQILPDVEGLRVKKKLGVVRQYQYGFQLENDGYLLLSDNEKQGSLLELSGEPLSYIRDKGIDDDSLVKLLTTYSDLNLHTTRLDYCFNTDNKEATVWSACEEWFKGEKKTRITALPDFHGKIGDNGIDSAGMTVYFGSEKSPNRIAVYDKATQMKKLGQALTRVELRMYGEYAQNAISDIRKYSALEVGKAKLKKTLDFPKLAWWQELYSGEHIELTPRKDKAANAVKYLVNTIDPFVKKNIGEKKFREMLASYMVEWIKLTGEIEE
jgi:hypothetical protein